ncbi:MAG: hypothetical protein ACOCX0_05495, partial [Bacteroidota bacterium]
MKIPLRFISTAQGFYGKVALIFLIGLSGSHASFSQTQYWSYIHQIDDLGNWQNKETWTTVPGGTDIEDDEEDLSVPSNGDIVTITQNTTVWLSADVNTTGLSITIEENATLRLGTHQIATLAELKGSGTLEIHHAHFPEITGVHSFASSSGGTVKFKNLQSGFNNLIIPTTLNRANHLVLESHQTEDLVWILGHDMEVSGNLHLINKKDFAGKLNLLLGENSSVELIVGGNIQIDKNTYLGVSQHNAIHQITLNGDLQVDGTLKLSNSIQYETNVNNGAAVFTFSGTTNTRIMGSGSQLDFYRLILDKGTDQTYMLDVAHTALRLFGQINLGNQNSGDALNPIIRKALWIRNGTLRLREGIFIPTLSSGGNDFFIPETGGLWIDGANVHSTTTNGSSGNTGITVIGTLRISAGLLKTNKSAGVVYRGAARMIVEGSGELHISQLRPSTASGTHQASWEQHGGIVTVDRSGENNNNHGRFSIPLSSHSFTMTGGELNILNPNGNNRGLIIGTAEGNTTVSGGTVNLYIPNDKDFGVSSTTPFYVLNVFKTGGTTRNLLLTDINHTFGNNLAQPLTVFNELTLHEDARLNANGNNVTFGGNVTLETGARYISGSNTTRFYNGDETNKSIVLNNAVSGNPGPLSLHHVIFDIENKKTYNFSGPGTNADYTIEFNGDVTHNGARTKLNFNNFRVHAKGSITIEDFPTTKQIEWQNTVLTLNGNIQQNLKIRGWYGKGPSRILLNNSAGARLLEDVSLGGSRLELQQGILHIGARELTTHHPIE